MWEYAEMLIDEEMFWDQPLDMDWEYKWDGWDNSNKSIVDKTIEKVTRVYDDIRIIDQLEDFHKRYNLDFSQLENLRKKLWKKLDKFWLWNDKVFCRDLKPRK